MYRSTLLDSLPTALRYVLDPDSDFSFEGERDRDYLLRHFVPLLALKNGAEIQVLNVQAAAMVGKDGLGLLFKAGEPGCDGSRADLWTTEDLEDGDIKVLDQILARLPYDGSSSAKEGDAEMQDDSDIPFEDELKRTAERYNAFQRARSQLRNPDCKVALRRVRLEDVMNQLHPLLKRSVIDIEFVPPTAKRQEEVVKQLEAQGTHGFVQRLRAFWDGVQPPMSIVNGELGAPANVMCATFTDVAVVHEK